MSQVSVSSKDRSSSILTQYPIECPFCHSKILPNYLYLDDFVLFASCPNSTCEKHFVLNRDRNGNYILVQPNAVPKVRTFSEIINSISSNFTEIYNQAFHAVQTSLHQICGVGYRKALEFLIKDYLISKETDEQVIEGIKKKFLSNCIQENVQNENIKSVAKRAVWIGNDETHYIRKWADL